MTIRFESDSAVENLNLNDEEIIRNAQKNTDGDIDFTAKPLKEFTVEELVLLVSLLLQYVRTLMLNKLDLPVEMKELQELLDTLNFQRKKDSTTSGMRPSSDMYRGKESKEKDLHEKDCEVKDDKDTEPTHPDSPVAEDKEKSSLHSSDTCNTESSDKSEIESDSNTDKDSQVQADTNEDLSQADAEKPVPGSSEELSPEEQEKDSEEKLRKDRNRSRRQKSGKSKGHQRGVPSKGFSAPPHIDCTREEIVMPTECNGCQFHEQCMHNARFNLEGASLGTCHHVYDIEIRITDTQIKPAIIPCPISVETDNSTVKVDPTTTVQSTEEPSTSAMPTVEVNESAVVPVDSPKNVETSPIVSSDAPIDVVASDVSSDAPLDVGTSATASDSSIDASASVVSSDATLDVDVPAGSSDMPFDAGTSAASTTTPLDTAASTTSLDPGNSSSVASGKQPDTPGLGAQKGSGNTSGTPKQERRVLKGEYPTYASGTKQYGMTLMILCCLLYCVGMVSLTRIQQIVGPIAGGIALSPATIERYVLLLAICAKPAVDAILVVAHSEKVVHCDETGAKVDGNLYWIHCVATQTLTFVSCQKKRGKEGTDAIGFLTDYVGCVVHDCWSTYWKYGTCTHAVCNEHIERELVGLAKFFKDADKWANDMLNLMQRMLQAKHDALQQNLKEIPPEILKGFSLEFDNLIAKAKEIHGYIREPGTNGKKGKKGRARALVDRMESHKAEIFRFLTDFDVPYTNNTAEQAFRMISTRRNVGIFRTFEGAEAFCVIWSYLSTAKKNGHSYYEAVRQAFLGNALGFLFPNGVPETKAPTAEASENADSECKPDEQKAA